jgi:hypothetical protein
MNNPSGTDWARIDAMTDDEIDTSDIPLMTEDFFAKATLRLPKAAKAKAEAIGDTESPIGCSSTEASIGKSPTL